MINVNEMNKMFNDMTKMYEINVENFSKIYDLNVNTIQKAVSFQNDAVAECINYTTGNVNKLAGVKSPKDLETYVTEVVKQAEKIGNSNSEKVLGIYKNYAEQLNTLFNAAVKSKPAATK